MYDATGMLSRDFETTYHRQCRTLLVAFVAAAKAWEEIATFDGLRWAKEAVEGWEDVAAAIKLGQRANGSTRLAKGPTAASNSKAHDKRRAMALDPKQAHDPILGPGGMKETRIADATERIEAAQDGLTVVLDRLVGCILLCEQECQSIQLQANTLVCHRLSYTEQSIGQADYCQRLAAHATRRSGTTQRARVCFSRAVVGNLVTRSFR
jgi:hypothetical protein